MADETFQERVDRERIEEATTYRALFNGLAAHLPGWFVFDIGEEDYGSNWAYRLRLVNQDKNSLVIWLRIDRGKVHVSGSWPKSGENGQTMSPHNLCPRQESPSIACSLSRGYAAIAKDISRRFIPEYIRVFELCEAKVAADNLYRHNKANAFQKIVLACRNVEPRQRQQHSQDQDQHGTIRFIEPGYGNIRMIGDNSVQIDLCSISVEQAIAVLKALEVKE